MSPPCHSLETYKQLSDREFTGYINRFLICLYLYILIMFHLFVVIRYLEGLFSALEKFLVFIVISC